MTEEPIEVRLARIEEQFKHMNATLDRVESTVCKLVCAGSTCAEKFVSKAEVRLVWFIIITVAGATGMRLVSGVM